MHFSARGGLHGEEQGTMRFIPVYAVIRQGSPEFPTGRRPISDSTFKRNLLCASS